MLLSTARIAFILGALCSRSLFAQEMGKPTTAVPRLVRLTGAFHPVNGLPIGTTEGVTLSIYKEEQGGQPLWQETQNVALDANGQYTAMLGITQQDGVPVDLFSSNETRWLGIQFNRPGEVEQARILLVSVPYALKARDAETLGGRPASAYLLDLNAASADAANISTSGSATGIPALPNPKSLKPHAINGAMNYLPYFTDNFNDLGNSAVYQNGTNVGIGTVSAAAPLTVFGNSGREVARFQGSSDVSNNRNYLSIFTTNPSFWWELSNQDPAGNGSLNGLAFRERSGSGPSLVRVYVAQGGAVGIGTTAPAGLLHLRGSLSGLPATSGTAARHVITRLDDMSNAVLDIGGNGGGGFWFQATDQAGGFGYHYPILLNPNGGSVGIGTITPGSTLDVAGDINLSGSVLYRGSPLVQVPGGAATANFAFGLGSLRSNTSGTANTATGESVLLNNTTGNDNTATGDSALYSNNTGSENTATGVTALVHNSTGNANTAIGTAALLANTFGSNNTAMGFGALSSNTTGINNIAIGYNAASNPASGNSNNIHVGSQGASADNGTIRIGTPGTQTSFFAAGIRAVTTGSNNAVPVLIDSAGQLGTVSSSRRYKEDIQDMGDASHGLMRLRPVTFRYQKPFADGSKPIQYGLIAEEVAEVYPDLVAHSADGQTETVKYQLLDSMLLNEVQKQQREITALKDQNQALQERLSRLEAAVVHMTRGAGIQ